jgi:hypothetical protein
METTMAGVVAAPASPASGRDIEAASGMVNSGVDGEGFLGQASKHPQSPEVPGYRCARLHPIRRTDGRQLSHGL